MSSQAHHIRRLAAALAAGPMEDREALVARAKPLVGDLRKARWLAPLARNLSLEFGEAPRPTVRRIAERIRAHEGFVKAWTEGRGRISIGQSRRRWLRRRVLRGCGRSRKSRPWEI